MWPRAGDCAEQAVEKSAAPGAGAALESTITPPIRQPAEGYFDRGARTPVFSSMFGGGTGMGGNRSSGRTVAGGGILSPVRRVTFGGGSSLGGLVRRVIFNLPS